MKKITILDIKKIRDGMHHHSGAIDHYYIVIGGYNLEDGQFQKFIAFVAVDEDGDYEVMSVYTLDISAKYWKLEIDEEIEFDYDEEKFIIEKIKEQFK